jgi:hypothetical protein
MQKGDYAMWCLKCGEKEPGDQEKCKTCDYSIGPPENRLYLHQLMRLTGDLLTGNLTKDAYSIALTNADMMLDDMYKGITSIEGKLNEENLPEAGKHVMSRPMNSFKEGIDVFSSALEELRMYLVDPEEDHLRKGLKLVEKANNTMFYCFEVSQYAMKEIKKFVPEEKLPTEGEAGEELKKMMSAPPKKD